MSFPFFGREKVIGSKAPDALYVGRYRDPATGKPGAKIQIPGTEPAAIIGRNRSGKDTGITIPNALTRRGLSTVWWDTRGEGAAISLPYRSTLGPAWIDNPFGELVGIPGYADLQSDGVNLLKARDLDPDNPLCFDHVCALIEPMIPAEGDHQPFFPMSGQSLYAAVAMQELKEAKREGGRDPSLVRVRMKGTEADEFEPNTGEPVKGIAAQARRMLAEGDPQICSLIGGFAGKATDGTRDVVATAAAHTKWLLSTAIGENEKLALIDFAQLGQVATSLYISLPHNLVKTHAAYLRMVATAVLQPLFEPHEIPVCLWLNEFAAMGRVSAIDSALGLVAGSGIQLVVVVQSLGQLAEHYERAWEAFLGQAGAVVLVGSAGDKFTADYLSARSGEMTIRQPHVGWSLNPGGAGLSSGDAYSRRPYLMPQDLYDIPPGQGYIWLAGLADPIPACFPPYYDDPVLSRRARANPYYRG